MASKLYESLVVETQKDQPWGKFVRTYGKGTEYEAIALVSCDDETAQWDGFLIFRAYAFSPLEYPEDFGDLLQFKYFPPGAANGVLAETRAKNYWETLCSIFKGLQPS